MFAIAHTRAAADLRCWTDCRGREYSRSVRPTIEAEVDEDGNIRPKEPVSLPPGSQLLITVLRGSQVAETALLSEASLAADWNRAEEDAAWADLQQA
jgi:hypothetical protein